MSQRPGSPRWGQRVTAWCRRVRGRGQFNPVPMSPRSWDGVKLLWVRRVASLEPASSCCCYSSRALMWNHGRCARWPRAPRSDVMGIGEAGDNRLRVLLAPGGI